MVLDTIPYEVIVLYAEMFTNRLRELRKQNGHTARCMSLDLGQNEGYINNIESGKSYPKMENFFYICEYLNVTPKEFFDTDNAAPEHLNKLIENLKKLDRKQLDTISQMVNALLEK